MDTVIGKVCRLFVGHEDLLHGFNYFLPEGHRMPHPHERQHLMAGLAAGGGGRGHPPPPGGSLHHPGMAGGPRPPPLQQQQQQQPPPPPQPGGGPAQTQINDAMRYMDTVRELFADRPNVYVHFLDIMKDFQAQR